MYFYCCQDYVLLNDHSHGCQITAPANTEIWVRVRDMAKIPPDNEPNYEISHCRNRVKVNVAKCIYK